jgi:hypothetical protein
MCRQVNPSCFLLSSFKPTEHDEIFCQVGDEIFIALAFPDGWCKGMNSRTGEVGLFPQNCLDRDVFDLGGSAASYPTNIPYNDDPDPLGLPTLVRPRV